MARVVAEGVPHHITQRGNNRQDVLLRAIGGTHGTHLKTYKSASSSDLKIHGIGRMILAAAQPEPLVEARAGVLKFLLPLKSTT